MGVVRVDRKYSQVLFGIIMATIMGFVMSLVITLINIGLASNFL